VEPLSAFTRRHATIRDPGVLGRLSNFSRVGDELFQFQRERFAGGDDSGKRFGGRMRADQTNDLI
jgi:hypothetical protein